MLLASINILLTNIVLLAASPQDTQLMLTAVAWATTLARLVAQHKTGKLSTSLQVCVVLECWETVPNSISFAFGTEYEILQ